MEMDSASRSRSFDRSSRNPATLKKPRLVTEEPTILHSNHNNRNPNGNGRPIVQRQSVGFRQLAERDGDSDSRGGGGGYQPQSLSQIKQQQHQELVNRYRTALAELTFNSKPIITNLTIIAGENLQAAKAIAATICNNIIEVPSDQKLPSLYLLDSIVKNIGRDYIKHFSAKLPEVFCKAYGQVDSAIHSGMRHLFGTWKGVFPPQSLQSIEKELGFQSAGNGSSSGLTTSRSESQPQRPGHSIHVNPKYLEARQKLQQSSRVKGATSDISTNLICSPEDSHRPDGTAAERTHTDPRMKMHNIQQAQRDAENDLTNENSRSTYNNFDYGSDILSPSETISRLGRNGFDLKHDLPNYSAPRPAIGDLKLQPMNNRTSKRGVEISRSWKNSEEEEYMWDDVNSKSAIPGASSSFKRDPRLYLETESSGFENHLQKSQLMHDLGSNLEREPSSDLPSTEPNDQAFRQRMVLLRSQGSSLTDANDHLGRKQLDNPVGLSTSFSRASTLGAQAPAPAPAPAPAYQRPPAQYQSSRFPHDLAEQDADGKTVRSQGQINTGLSTQSHQDSFQTRPPTFLLGNSRKPQIHSLHPKKHAPFLPPPQPEPLSEPSPQSPISLATNPLVSSSLTHQKSLVADIPGPSNTSSLLAAVSSIFANKPVPGSVPESSFRSESSSQSQPNVPRTTQFATSGTGVVSSHAASDPVSSLLSSLVAKGLISASKDDPSQNDNTPTSQEVSPIVASSVLSSSTTKQDIKCLIGFDFKPDVIREFHHAVISDLIDDLPHQCGTCGLRFKLQERFDRHTEWHTLRNTESNAPNTASRRWFSNSDNWVSRKPDNMDCAEDALEIDGVQMVRADESQFVCVLCGETFDDFYSPESSKWLFKGASYLNMSDGVTRGPIVHQNCISEHSLSDLGLASDVKVEKGV